MRSPGRTFDERENATRPPTVSAERPRCPACGADVEPGGWKEFGRLCRCGLRLRFTPDVEGRLSVQGSGIGPHGLRADRHTRIRAREAVA
jgi:hypothetical protein